MTMGCGLSGYASTIVPTSMSYTSGGTSNYSSNCGKNQMSAVTSSTSSHALTTYDGTGLSNSGIGNVSMGTCGVNVSPLPVRAHQMNTMPPLSQVCIYYII